MTDMTRHLITQPMSQTINQYLMHLLCFAFRIRCLYVVWVIKVARDCVNIQGGPKNEATLHFPKYLENY